MSDPKRTFSKFLSQGGFLKNTFLRGPYPLFQFFLSGIAKPRAKAPCPLRRTELPAFLESLLPRYCQADFLQMVLSLSICPSKGKRGKHLQDGVEYINLPKQTGTSIRLSLPNELLMEHVSEKQGFCHIKQHFNHDTVPFCDKTMCHVV